MTQLSIPRDPKEIAHQSRHTCCSSSEDLLRAILLRQYVPIAPSPLNPDTARGRSLHRARKLTPTARKPPEISPTLRLLRRKAAIAYKRSTEHSLPSLPLISQARNAFNVADDQEESADVTDGLEPTDDEESLPATFIVESGPLIQIVHLGCHRSHSIEDPEKQLYPDRSLFQRWQGSRQRIQFYLVMCLMSSCLTFFSVFALELFRRGPLLTR